MEREIKFRGLSRHGQKEWFYGNLFVKNIEGHTHIGTPERTCLDVEYKTVGQFTGHKDKNGTDIYEHDIIKTPMGDIGIIKFGTHENIVHTREATRQGYNVDCFECTGWLFEKIKTKGLFFMDSSIIAGEVIGNIYDNPELIK